MWFSLRATRSNQIKSKQNLGKLNFCKSINQLERYLQSIKQRSAKPPSPSSNLGAASSRNLAYSGVFVFLSKF
jgi:hypothetical protein